jgi:hypothetical protein
MDTMFLIHSLDKMDSNIAQRPIFILACLVALSRLPSNAMP